MKSALSQSQQLFLLALVFCVILPHALFQPIWLTVALFGLWGWRFGVVIKKLPSGAQWIKYGLLVGVLIGFVLTYSGGVSTEGMVALLNAGLILKLIETHDRRAAWIVVGVSILTSAAFFLRNQSVIGALYILLMIAFVLFVMVRLNADHQSIGVSCKKAFLVLAQALPITVLLFIILPRIPPLWAVPASGSAVTGVAERFSPGQISNLTRTSDVAFRVKFDGNLPSRANLYWRMMTYSEFDGVEWVADKPTERLGQHVIAEIKREEQAQRYRYEVLTQPNGVGALPLLSTPVSASSGLMDTFLRSNNTLRRDRPFIEGALYQAESVLSAHWPAESGRALSLALRMPQGNPRLVALAKELARNSATQEELIAALLDIYRQAFSYSLSPLPTRGSNSVDQFLFETQEGFCGHFAGATALVLRAAGIPARVVAGYQGGEYTDDGYIIVRAYDAHAWVEAWIQGRGWVRIDPTQVVEAGRLETAMADFYANNDEFLAHDAFARAGLNYAWLGQVRSLMDSVNYEWQRWVLGYKDQQEGFLKGLLGEISPWRVVMALLVPGGGVLALIMLMTLSRPRLTKSEVDRLLSKLDYFDGHERKQRAKGESLRQYMARLAALFPDHADYFSTLEQLYTAYRYQPPKAFASSKTAMDMERALIRHLKRKPKLKLTRQNKVKGMA